MSRVKSKDLSTVIQELEAKIRILEEENTSLADEAEGTLLLSLVSETLDRHEDIQVLLENGLERIAVLKNIPFCSCCKREENTITPISSYVKYNDEKKTLIDIQLDKKIIQEIEQESAVYKLSKNKKIKLKIQDDKQEYIQSFILLIPFKTRFIQNGVFIFTDDNESDRLTGYSFVIQHMVNMITERIDKLMLKTELQEMNKQLEKRVEARTKELKEVNENLKNEIKERIKTEEALFQSETKFRSITEQLSDIIFLTDSNGMINYISPAAENLFGWTQEEMTQKIFTEFLVESEIPKAFEAFSKTLGQRINTRELSLLMKRKDGSVFYGELDATIFQLHSGLGTLGVIRDISKRKQDEEEIKQTNLELVTLNRIISESVHQLDSKVLLRTALNEALKISGLEGGTVCMITPQNTLKLVVEINTSEATKLDLETNQIMVGECLCGLCAKEHKPLILDTREDVLKFSSREVLRQEPIKFHAAFPIVAKGKSIGVLCVFTYTDIKPIQRSIKLIETLTEQISLSLENANLYEEVQRNLADLEEEISERKHAQEELIKNDAKLKSIFSTAPIGIGLVQGRDIVEVNDTLCNMVGYSREELLGKNSRILYPSDEEYEFVVKEKYKEIIENRVGTVETHWCKKNGELLDILLCSSPLDGDNLAMGVTFTAVDITERKRASEALRKSEERLSFALSATNDAIWDFMPAQEILYWSPRYYTMLGYQPDDFLASVDQWRLLVHPDDLSEAEKALSSCLVGNEDNYSQEVRFRTKQGEYRWILVRGKVSRRDGNGNVLRMTGTHTDITERKNAEIALHESEQLFRIAFDNAPTGMSIIKAPDFKYLAVNPLLCEMFGYSKEEFLGQTIKLVTHPDDEERSNEWIRKKYNGEPCESSFEKRYIHKDGHIIWGLVSSQWIQNEDGSRRMAISHIQDITKSKLAEEELRKSEHEYKNLFDNASDAIIIFEPDSEIILEVNSRACDLYGFKREEFIGMSLKKLTINVLQGEKQIQKTLSDGSFKNYETQQFTKDGRIIDLSINASVIEYKGKEAIFSINHDITDRKRAEIAIQQSENLFRNMNNNSPLGMHFYELTENLELIFTGANPAADKLLGVDNSQFIGKTIEQAFPYLAQTEAPARYRDAAIKGTLWSTEQIIYKEGQIDGAFEVKAFQTTPGKMVAVFMDVTVRTKAENALRESEEKFRTIFNQSPIGIELYDSDGMQIGANKASLDMFGITDVTEVQKFNMFEGTSLTEELKEKLRRGESVSYQSTFDFEKIKELNQYKTNRSGKAYLDYLITPISGNETKTSIGFLLQVQDITERKKVEEALLESEEIFNQFMKHSPVYLFFKDHEIRTLRLSDNFEKMLGRPLNELIGKTMNDLFPSELARSMIADDQRILREGKEVHVDEELNGRFYTTIKFPIHVGGKPVYLAGFTIDVTERKMAEEEINMLANALKSVDESVTITDINENLIFANQSFSRLYGYDGHELIGKSINVLRSVNNPTEMIDEIFPSTLHGGWNGELMNIRKDGSEFPIYLSTSVINDKDGKPMGLIGVAQDITERKRVEHEIISQRNKLEQMIKNSPVAIVSMNWNEEILEINESFTNLFGYSSGEAIGKYLNDLVLSDEYREEGENLTIVARSGRSTSSESYRRKKDGSLVFVQIVGVPIKIQDQVIGIYGMYVDLTHRIIAEQEILRAKELAEQSDKMKSEFLAQMSHEIRTPINIIVSNISFIKEQLENQITKEDEDCFSSINLASQRMIRTIDLILNMSELQTGAYKPTHSTVDLDSHVLQYLYNEFQRSAKTKGIDLIYKNEIRNSEIHADEYSITQIFANLIDNAIKYTNKGMIELFLTKNINDELMVEVRDTGIGINKEFLPHLFEPFVQEEQGYTRSFEGNGLGLSLVKKYCEINNARIEVESQKNIGSTFRVIFNK